MAGKETGRFGPYKRNHHRAKMKGRRKGALRDDFEDRSNKGDPYINHGPLSDIKFNILDVAIANVRFPNDPLHGSSFHRPYALWGKYYDPSGLLQAVDCLGETTKVNNVKDHCIYNLLMRPEMTQSMGGNHCDVAIYTSKIYYFRNHASIFEEKNAGRVPQEVLPDLILRRASSLLYYHINNEDTGLFKRNHGYVRHGFVFPTIKRNELKHTRFAPEIEGAPFEQVPIEIPGFLEQEQIDRICLIARHYVGYCIENHLPIIFPEAGQWGQWPKAFMDFAEKPESNNLRLSWMGPNRSRFRTTGFPCLRSVIDAPFPA